MKDITRKKCTTMQVSGNFKSWTKEAKDGLCLHGRSIKELIKYFDSNWITDQKLSYEETGKCCAKGKLDIDVDSALHTVTGAFLEGESKVLAGAAEVNNAQSLEMHQVRP